MNIGRLANGNSDHQNATNENAMYHTPPIVGLSPRLSGHNLTYRLRADLNDSKGLVPPEADIVTEYSLEEREFYQSYDPNVGLHTAAVLGGILVLLILFLLYKTKCKKAVKALVKHIRKKHRQRKLLLEQEASMGKSVPSVVEPMCNSTDACSVGCGECECESVACDEQPIVCQTNDCCPGNSHSCVPATDAVMMDTSPRGSNMEVTSTEIPTFNISGPSPSSSPVEDSSFQTLPVLETDIATATALWVQDMPLSSQSVNDVSGVILQVQSNMTKMHTTGSCPLQTMLSQPSLTPIPLAQTWNKSLPILSKSITMSCEHMQLETGCDIQSKEQARSRNPHNLTIAIPDATDLSSTAKLRVHSPVPFPVTPTVTIQNFTSKGNSQHSSLQRDSNDSLTSNSSEDLLLVPSSSTLSWKCKNPRPAGWTGVSDSCELFSDRSKTSVKSRSDRSKTSLKSSPLNTETKF
ncbi:uncharacterized protein LOC121373885 [Gigantopelta aegis]|uniref:uncharacterized protein LOC121373885 n=1 Tax=Gigantopelta aegis TaxID=1735272 RepID=UPI001B88CF94|nr:uncharacterized protein LOC121373885 [Gigantopelta aegis]XP_041356616.1 uncharacterized protein LOC121373885 [Gigantopelta aegis]